MLQDSRSFPKGTVTSVSYLRLCSLCQAVATRSPPKPLWELLRGDLSDHAQIAVFGKKRLASASHMSYASPLGSLATLKKLMRYRP
jgi:hypothetical protein